MANKKCEHFFRHRSVVENRCRCENRLSICPKNTDRNCNIIQRKKVVIVKAWAYTSGTGGLHCFEKGGKHLTGEVSCTILIKAADYKRLKGEK